MPRSTCCGARRLLRGSAAWQREGASRHPLSSHLLRFLWIFLVLPLIGAAHVLMREGHPHELAVLEEEACRAGPVLVLFLLEFAEDALRFQDFFSSSFDFSAGTGP